MRLRSLTAMSVAIATVGALAFVGGSSGAAERSDAGDPFVACADPALPSARLDCLERATRRHATPHGTTAAIRELERAATRDAQVAIDCHMALHPLGADSGRRIARDGKALPLARPRSFCHEGYVHGMQVAWLDAAPTGVLVRTGALACDSSDPTIDWACGHSLGHAFASRAGSGAMPTAMRWCDLTYDSAVHLGLDRDGFMTTCAKGALMEFTIRDERAGVTDPRRHACDGVDDRLLPWCEGHAWLRAGLGSAAAPTELDQLAACDELATSATGRQACAGIVGRGMADEHSCDAAAVDLRGPCRRASRLGPIDPAAIPAS